MKNKTLKNRLILAFASLIVAAGLTSCTDVDGTKTILKQSGFHPITVDAKRRQG